MHFQPGQAKLVRCVRGAILDVIVDIRRGSPQFGAWEAFAARRRDSPPALHPDGFAHGFCVLSELADVTYKISSYYDPRPRQGSRSTIPRSRSNGPGAGADRLRARSVAPRRSPNYSRHCRSSTTPMRDRLAVTPLQYRRVAYATLASLTVIVMTGAAVRLTGSGLGCANWPKCCGSTAAAAQLARADRVRQPGACPALVGVITVVAAVLAVHAPAVPARPGGARGAASARRRGAGGARRVDRSPPSGARLRDGALQPVAADPGGCFRARVADSYEPGGRPRSTDRLTRMVGSGIGSAGRADDLRRHGRHRFRTSLRRVHGSGGPSPAFQGRRHPTSGRSMSTRRSPRSSASL